MNPVLTIVLIIYKLLTLTIRTINAFISLFHKPHTTQNTSAPKSPASHTKTANKSSTNTPNQAPHSP